MAEPLHRYVLPDYAVRAMRRRRIDFALVRSVLEAPEQRYVVRSGREVLQSRALIDGRLYLLRVFADTDRDPAEIVTVYRTTKVAKYWREEA